MPAAVLSKFCPLLPHWRPWPHWLCWPHAQTKPHRLHLLHPLNLLRPHLRPQQNPPHPHPRRQLLKRRQRQQRHQQPPPPPPVCQRSIQKTPPLWPWVLSLKPAKPMWPSTRNTQPVKPVATALCSAAKQATPPGPARCLWANKSASKAGAALTPRKRLEGTCRALNGLIHANQKPPRGGFLLSGWQLKPQLRGTSRGCAQTIASDPARH